MIYVKYKKFIFISFLIVLFILLQENLKERKIGNLIVNEKNIGDSIGIQTHIYSSSVNVEAINENGFKIVRDDILWNNVEKKKNEYDFLIYDNYNKKLIKSGIRPYYILSYSNGLYERENSVVTKNGREAYSKFVGKATSRYKNQQAIWEIWNEPNSELFWNPTSTSVEKYTKLVKVTSPIIKKNDPSGIVVAPALGEVNDRTLIWLEESFKDGLLDYIDAISIHPYRATVPETVIKDYEKIRILIKKYTDKDIPIISGEWGYSTAPAFYGAQFNEIQQCQYLIRMVLINQYQGIPISIWYDWKNDGIDKNNGEHNFGIREYDETIPKQASIGAKNLFSILGEYHFSKRIDLNNKLDYLLEFANDKKEIVYVYWTQGSEHPLIWPDEISVKGKQTGMLGEQMGIINTKRSNIILTNSPAYLEVISN